MKPKHRLSTIFFVFQDDVQIYIISDLFIFKSVPVEFLTAVAFC